MLNIKSQNFYKILYFNFIHFIFLLNFMLSGCNTGVTYAHNNAVNNNKYIYKISSPIDGYVVNIANEGDIFKPVIPEAQVIIDELRSSFGLQKMYTVNVSDLSKQSDNDLIALIGSDLHELQLKQENEKVIAAQKKLDATMKTVHMEAALAPEELKLLTEKNEVNDQRAFADSENSKNVLGDNRATSLRTSSIDAGTISYNNTKTRQDHLLNIDIPERIRIANHELEIARNSLKIIMARIKFGEISCPFKCKVIKVHAFKRQFVTKGDLLLEIQKISQ